MFIVSSEVSNCAVCLIFPFKINVHLESITGLVIISLITSLYKLSSTNSPNYELLDVIICLHIGHFIFLYCIKASKH